MTIARILTAKGRDVITTQPDRTLAEVAEVLVAKKIGAVVVVDDQGRLIGLLSERDIVRVLAEHGAAVFNDAVSVHMTTEVIATSEDESIYAVMEKMTKQRSRHLLVIRDEKLVGLVSIGDMVKHRGVACCAKALLAAASIPPITVRTHLTLRNIVMICLPTNFGYPSQMGRLIKGQRRA
jgi:CBS domain-containing protein